MYVSIFYLSNAAVHVQTTGSSVCVIVLQYAHLPFISSYYFRAIEGLFRHCNRIGFDTDEQLCFKARMDEPAASLSEIRVFSLVLQKVPFT